MVLLSNAAVGEQQFVNALAELRVFVGHGFRPRSRLASCQDLPESSERKTPTAEIPTNIRSGFSGSRTMECRQQPTRAPGFHLGRVGMLVEVEISDHVFP